MALFISAIALDQSFVNAQFSESMCAIVGNGDDLHLVLDNTAGKHNLLVTYNY